MRRGGGGDGLPVDPKQAPLAGVDIDIPHPLQQSDAIDICTSLFCEMKEYRKYAQCISNELLNVMSGYEP